MKTIWKYEIGFAARFKHAMPAGAEIIAVQTQDGMPFMWAIVDPDAPRELRSFFETGTGRSFDSEGLTYIGTYQMGIYVFHVFEDKAGD